MPFPFQTRSQEKPRPMEQYADVVGSDPQNLTDISCRPFFDLTQVKDVPMLIRQCREAAAQRVGGLAGLYDPIGGGW